MRATLYLPRGLPTILLSGVVLFSATVATAQHAGVETGHPAGTMPAATAGSQSGTDFEPLLVQSDGGPSDEAAVIVDSSVDPDLVRIDSGAEPPFDIDHFA